MPKARLRAKTKMRTAGAKVRETIGSPSAKVQEEMSKLVVADLEIDGLEVDVHRINKSVRGVGTEKLRASLSSSLTTSV